MEPFVQTLNHPNPKTLKGFRVLGHGVAKSSGYVEGFRA